MPARQLFSTFLDHQPIFAFLSDVGEYVSLSEEHLADDHTTTLFLVMFQDVEQRCMPVVSNTFGGS